MVDSGELVQLIAAASTARGTGPTLLALRRAPLPAATAAALILPRPELVAARLTFDQQRAAVAALRAALAL